MNKNHSFYDKLKEENDQLYALYYRAMKRLRELGEGMYGDDLIMGLDIDCVKKINYTRRIVITIEAECTDRDFFSDMVIEALRQHIDLINDHTKDVGRVGSQDISNGCKLFWKAGYA